MYWGAMFARSFIWVELFLSLIKIEFDKVFKLKINFEHFIRNRFKATYCAIYADKKALHVPVKDPLSN
jgi:hypothetical protein